jgi:hypothetical protein
MPRTFQKGTAVRRHLVAFSTCVLLILVGGAAQAQDVINLDVRYGVGLSLHNRLNDSVVAPHYAHLEGSYLFLEVGPIQMGPGLAYRVGFGSRDVTAEDEEFHLVQVGTTDLQHEIRPAWVVQGRPNVHFSWTAWAGVDLVVTQPDVSQNGMDEDHEPYFIWGLEAGGSASYFLTAGFAITLGVQYAFFYGIDPVHVLAFDLGLRFSFEVL